MKKFIVVRIRFKWGEPKHAQSNGTDGPVLICTPPKGTVQS